MKNIENIAILKFIIDIKRYLQNIDILTSLAAIRFCWKASFNATKTFEMIRKVYGESAVHHATVLHWYNAIIGESIRDIRDKQRSGRPMTTKMCENIARVANILKEDCLCLYVDLQRNVQEYQKLSCNKFCVKIYRNGNSARDLCYMH